MNNIDDMLKGLNEEQYNAAIDYEGPAFVMAGAGSGKTKVMVSRTAYMISRGVKPENILLFTFTNKAGKEITERITELIGDKAKNITMGTYHSVCVRILRKYSNLLGYESNFSIYDSEDSLNLIKKIIKNEHLDLDAQVVKALISGFKGRSVSVDKAYNEAINSYHKSVANVYRAYEDELFKLNAMDFDSLIQNTIRLLETNYDVKQTLNNKYKYIISDESQDANYQNIQLIELLAGNERNICYILDYNQSIYSFRGANVNMMINLPDRYPNVKMHNLKINYRSSKNIVDAAESLISNNKEQIKREVTTLNSEGSKIKIIDSPNSKIEATTIAKYVIALKEKSGCNYSDIAILYRMSYLSREIEEAFLVAGIPYQIKAGVPFYSRTEIKDIISFMRLAYNPYDYESFRRAVNIPKRGIGPAAIEKVFNYARDSSSTPLDFITAAETIGLTGKAGKGLVHFAQMMRTIQEDLLSFKPQQIINNIIEEVGYFEHLEKQNQDLNLLEDKITNIEELLRVSNMFLTVEEFIQNTILHGQTEDEEENKKDRVQLLTAHSSKGLEWEYVFAISANEGIMPHWRHEQDNTLEEERRLFYVLMTRAKSLLFITRPKMVLTHGKPTFPSISRFINEIDQDLLEYR